MGWRATSSIFPSFLSSRALWFESSPILSPLPPPQRPSLLGLTKTRTHGRSWATALQGVVGIAAGVLTFMWPGVTALALVIFIGAWAIVTGIFEIAAAIRLRKVIRGEWLLALSGILSVIFGVLVFAFPGAGAVGIAWILGAYSAAAGIILIALGIRLRSSLAVAL